MTIVGGFGSGRYKFTKKTTVEQCLTLDGNKILPIIVKRAHLCPSLNTGTLNCYKNNVMVGQINYRVEENEVIISHNFNNRYYEYPIQITHTQQPGKGGLRYWFSLPCYRLQQACSKALSTLLW